MSEREFNINEKTKIDWMVKRIRATLAIEGNSLTEEQIREIYLEMHPEQKSDADKKELND